MEIKREDNFDLIPEREFEMYYCDDQGDGDFPPIDPEEDDDDDEEEIQDDDEGLEDLDEEDESDDENEVPLVEEDKSEEESEDGEEDNDIAADVT